ncbi:MAG: biotin carboxylase, partial [Gemmatimonadetes bacterium]|nr:biotin carboxylase [Gemmatimonadota bacterium]NIR79273.1 biotin carboxylase [Gemmatimonadota bacterium]NIT88743.1 biotin carboxylase [Gemmatimonadota bacterium]NIU32553.1 biotin carboxylase [Gemmatimonadota bacterium]NIU37014.1 biotin carboxylase [Gemmatimonadota bacterium]
IGGRCARVLSFGAGMSLEELVLRHAAGLEVPSFERDAGAAGVMMLPVSRRGRLMEVRGREEAEAVPGIRGLDVTIAPGKEVLPLPEGHRYLGFLYARG